jgi:hypothetical protein
MSCSVMPSAASVFAARETSLANCCSDLITRRSVPPSVQGCDRGARYSRLRASSQSGAPGKLNKVMLIGCHAQTTEKEPKRSRLPSQETRTGSPSGGANAIATIAFERTKANPGHVPCACATMTRFAAFILKNRPSNPMTAFCEGHTSARMKRRSPLTSSRRSTARRYAIALPYCLSERNRTSESERCDSRN